jgi:Ca2+-binding EF-hand superfamily protein
MNRADCRRGIVLLVAALVSGGSSLARAAEPPPAPRWQTDVFFLCQRRLVVLRLFARSGSRDLSAAWDRATSKFFKTCDADHNGLLAGPELRQVPTRQQLAQFGMARQPAAAQAASPDGADSAGATLSLAEFQAYLRGAGVDPFLLEEMSAAAPVSAGSTTQAPAEPSPLFRALDADSSGRLSRLELQNAAQSVQRFDLDEDGILTRRETRSSPAASNRVRGARPAEPKSAATVASAGSHAALAHRIVGHYDRPTPESTVAGKDGKLSAAELRWTAAALRPHDADGDGQLDFDELARWVARPTPTVVFTVRHAGPSGGWGLTQLVAGMFSRDSAADTSGEWDFASARLVLTVDDASVVSDIGMQQMFGFADRDQNKYLDAKEAAILGSGAALFQYLDSDADGKVFETEWATHGGRLMALAQAQLRLQVSDRGQPLFEALDEDQDGRLDRHELGDLSSRLSAWDADGDAAVSPGEVPQLLRIVASNEVRLFTFAFSSSVETSVATSSEPDAPRPAWFRAMDRNNDGELSRLEFVGKLDRFQQLDADRDGFISAKESRAKTAASH